MTHNDHDEFIGKKALIPCGISGNIKVEIFIKDSRTMMGRHELFVAPIKGTGEAWITRNKVEILN